MGIYWTDKTRTDPCYPAFNELGNDYICRSRIYGISDVYYKAQNEIVRIYNEQNAEIDKLKRIIEDRTKAEKQGNVNSYPMQGRKPSALNKVQSEKAWRMYQDEIKIEVIARHFGVSKRTISRVVKRLLACKSISSQ
jgi:hypothetical protein